MLDSSFLLAIRFTHGSVHMSVLFSQFIPPSPSPSVSTSPFSISPGAFSLDYSLFRFSSNTLTWGLRSSRTEPSLQTSSWVTPHRGSAGDRSGRGLSHTVRGQESSQEDTRPWSSVIAPGLTHLLWEQYLCCLQVLCR